MKRLLLVGFLAFFAADSYGQNVGVGTVTPTDQLHTTGSVRFEGYRGPSTRTVQIDSSGRLIVTGNGPINSSTSVLSIKDTSCVNGVNGTVSTITVAGITNPTATAKIAVRVNITHTYDGDLKIYLVAPNGAVLCLANSTGASGDNFTNTIFTDAGLISINGLSAAAAPMTDKYKPSGLLTPQCTIIPTVSTFAAIGGGSINPIGNWTLKIFDANLGDVGTLNSWDISFSGPESFTTNDQSDYIPKFNNGNLVSSNIFQDSATGNIGVNTKTPAAALEVSDTGTTNIQVTSTTSDQSSFIMNNRSLFGNTSFTLANVSGVGLKFTAFSRFFLTSTTTDVMFMTTAGNVGINRPSPTNKLEVAGNLSLYNASGLMTLQMFPTESAGMGSAINMYNINGTMTIDIDADNGANHRGRIITDEIQIKGGSDFAEDFTITPDADHIDAIPGMLVAADPEREGNVQLTAGKYDRKVIGVISGANGVSPGMMMGQKGTLASGDKAIALAGRVYVLATDEGGPIKPGDFITSSSRKGYAMKANDLQKAGGAIIGKAMSKRNAETGFVLVVVNPH